MTVSVPIREFVKARRDRMVGSILGYAEREIWPKLTADERRAFRKVVLQAADGYHDSVLDLVKAEDGVVRNEELLNVLNRQDAVLSRIEAKMRHEH
jgi:hypothetical protein